MDGTLVDTEPYWMASEHELVAAFGGTWTDDDARSIVGFDLLDAAAELRDRGGVDLEPEEIVERLLDSVVARVREHVPWRPGARRLLTELNALGVPCALVTMSWARLVDAIVEALAPITFQAVITGDAVEHGKPHPQPYLLAAEALGVDPGAVCGDRGLATRCRVGRCRRLRRRRCPQHRVDRPGPSALHRADPEGRRARRPRRVGGHRARSRPECATAASERGARSCSPSAGVALVAIVAAVALRRDDDDDATPPVPTPAAVAVHAWTPYWALEDALPELDARASTLTQLSPLWWVATGVESIEVQANTPAAQAEQFVAQARDLGVPIVASILDGTGAGVMAGILADAEQRSRHIDTIAGFAADGDFAGIDIDYEQFAFADGRDTWAATRPELGRLRRGARRPPARRRTHPDRQHPARVRRRNRRRTAASGSTTTPPSRRTSTPSA